MKTILSVALLFVSAVIFGQGVPVAGTDQKGFTFDTNMLLILFAVFLLLPLWILSNTFIAAAKRYYENKLKSRSAKLLLPLAFILMSSTLFAQGTTASASSGLSATAMTILLLCVIGAELLLILFFAYKTNEFIQKKESRETVPATERDFLHWLKEKWAAMNFRPIEEEQKLDTGHNYDGIRELDNVVPPWFTTAFLLTILFAAVYFYRYHIAKSAPLQIEEYELAVAQAELKHDEYLKRQASGIDESNVTVMSGADLEAGAKIFVTLCAICHKTDGGGMVGPNLCDPYWIHGGALQDLFKTIKYGVPDKGMISWKDQLSPTQIAQVSNYILTLQGTNPPDAKEKQGELYIPQEAPADSVPGETVLPDTLIQQ